MPSSPLRSPYLQEGTQFAHEGGQVPALEEGRLELERDAEDRDDDVGHGQVSDVQVDHRVHASPGACKKKGRKRLTETIEPKA